MQISYGNREHIRADVDVEWNEERINNYIDCERLHDGLNVLYKLRTPKFRHEETLVTTLTYTPSGGYHNVTYVFRRFLGCTVSVRGFTATTPKC